MNGKQYQGKIFKKLRKIFNHKNVKWEWDVSKDAGDIFRRQNNNSYIPRIDLAIGPFNIDRNVLKNIESINHQSGQYRFIKEFKEKLGSNNLNPNPRCLLAIEICFSGDSKRLLGDLTNASMMGLIGIVVANDIILPKINAIKGYVEKLVRVGKAPKALFSNLIILSVSEFNKLLRKQK